MHSLSYRRHRFPPVVIQHAVCLYLRFSLSYRDVEELLAERGLDVSYESVRTVGCSNSDRRSPGLCDGAVLDRVIAGISTKWSSGSPAGICTCGARGIMRARSWRCWFSADETSAQPVRLIRKLLRKPGLCAQTGHD